MDFTRGSGQIGVYVARPNPSELQHVAVYSRSRPMAATMPMAPFTKGTTAPVSYRPTQRQKETISTVTPKSSSEWQLVALRNRIMCGSFVVSKILKLRVYEPDQDGTFVAVDTFSTVYGLGDSLEDAIEDYASSLTEQIDDLELNRTMLGPALEVERQSIRRALGLPSE